MKDLIRILFIKQPTALPLKLLSMLNCYCYCYYYYYINAIHNLSLVLCVKFFLTHLRNLLYHLLRFFTGRKGFVIRCSKTSMPAKASCALQIFIVTFINRAAFGGPVARVLARDQWDPLLRVPARLRTVDFYER
jgi:hypothetical protein